MKLKIFKVLDGALTEIDSLKRFMFKSGSAYGLLISGVEVDLRPKEFIISPVYVPFVQIDNRAGQIVLDFHLWTEKVWRFIFQKRKPFFAYVKIEQPAYGELFEEAE